MSRVFVMLSVVGVLFPCGGAAAQDKPDLYVFSAGIDRYQAPTNDLKGCINDAEGLLKVLQGQQGKQFGRVEGTVLTDAKAHHKAIVEGLKSLEAKGKAGDWYAIILSGHGGIMRHEWAFLTQDNRDLSDTHLLGLADRLAAAGKKVMIIIDACHAGQLRYAANEVLNRHVDASKGGIILMVSSMPAQTSTALGAYSAFARAVEEGLSGQADYDGDEAISLKELRRFTLNRVYELRLQKRVFPGITTGYQDSAIDASLSVSENTPLVRGKRTAPAVSKDDEPDIASSNLAEKTWKMTVAGTITSPPITFQLKLDPLGHYTASVTEGTRPVGISTGTYKVKAKSLHLIHHQGVDRLDVVASSASELQFRFQGRAFTLRPEATRAGNLVVDVSGRLAEEDPRDRIRKESAYKMHKGRLEAGVTYIIDLQSPDFDTYLRLEDGDGTNLAENDDGGEGRNSRLRYTPTRSGEYRVIATAFRGGIGVYHLHVERTDGPRAPDRTPVAQVILNENNQLTAADAKDRVRTNSHAKAFKLDLKAGAAYTIDMLSTDFDPYLRLEDNAGTQVAFDDDGGGNRNARITFTPTQSGSYRILATSYAEATGRFNLTVKGSGTAPAVGGIALNLQNGAARVEARLAQNDELDSVRKMCHRKVYLVNLEAGRGYTIFLKSTDFDSYLRLEDASGKQLDSNDDGGGGRDSRIAFTPAVSGTYRIIATTFGDRAMGAFTLSVSQP